jgi:signal transduction histidine kinase
VRRSSPLLLAAAIPAAGLLFLGFRATAAEEDRARLRSRELLTAAAEALSARAAAVLREADLAADSYDPAAPDRSPLLADVFVADTRGEVRVPALERYPAAPPPPAEEVAKRKRYLDAAAREREATGDPLEAVPFLEPAIPEFVHPDLIGRLLLELAGLYRDGGRADRARYFFSEIVTTLPGARAPSGAPLAPAAHAALVEIASPDEREAAVRTFLSRLADNAFDLPTAERRALLADFSARLSPPGLPPPLLARARLVDALTSRVVPEALQLLSPVWRHLSWSAPDGEQLFGFRAIELASGTHVLGYRLSGAVLAQRLRAATADLVSRPGARVEVDTDPPVREGRLPPGAPLSLATDLGGDVRAVRVRLSIAVPSPLGLLRWLHAGMTVLLLAALFAGVLLSRRALDRETKAARLRQQFVDNVSHELRTPLTSIRMYAEMLAEERGIPDADRDRYLGFILRESERLSRLVEDVLDFSRLSRGESRFSLQSCAPAELAAAAIELCAPLATEHGFTLRSEVPADLPPARADRDAVLRILANLLSNAIRYGGEAREAAVEGRAEGGAVLLTVRDRGPGIPPEEREMLFTRFWRSPRDARKVRGVGLGLVLAREIARALGGDLVLEEGPGTGSRFTLRLPAAAAGEEEAS